MAGGQQDAGGDAGSVPSYEDRGGDNQQDLTRYDENAMDRAAEAGFDGAFGANPDAEATREQARQDAEAAFGGRADEGSGSTGGS